jgi:uncharacterized protein (DUF2267 family)
MKYDEFIAQVERRTGLDSREAAIRATSATLETLAERLAGGEAKDLASQLPPEIGVYLQQPFAGAGEPFSLDEFFQRVSNREGVSLADATYHARIIIALISEVVTMGEIENVRSQLPTNFRELFDVEYEGQVPGQGVIDEEVIEEGG